MLRAGIPAPRLPRLSRAVRACSRGVSTIEFALILPLFVMTALYGTELAYYASVRLQISQIALSVADNAARLGQTENAGVTPTITESDVDSVMFGALQQGQGIDLESNGRIVLSSLERDNLTGNQWFHWQRCRGDLERASLYGPARFGLSGGALTGVGGQARAITAQADSAVMVAEVFYDYQPLFGTMFPGFADIREEAVFIIRDDRNLGDREGEGISPGASQSECP